MEGWLIELIKTEGVGFTALVIYAYITLRFLGYMKQRDKDITNQRAEEMSQTKARDKQNTRLLDLMVRSQNGNEAMRETLQEQLGKTNQTLAIVSQLLQKLLDMNQSNSANIDTLVQSTEDTTKATRDMIVINEELNQQIEEMVKEVGDLVRSLGVGVKLSDDNIQTIADKVSDAVSETFKETLQDFAQLQATETEEPTQALPPIEKPTDEAPTVAKKATVEPVVLKSRTNEKDESEDQ